MLTNITFEAGLAAVPANLFLNTLTESEVGISIPGSVKAIGNYAFQGCTSLKYIIFGGDAPSIASQSFKNVVADAYYSSNNTTWTDDVKQNYGGTITWNSECGSHIYENVITEPTCTEQGHTTHICINCGYSYIDNYVDVLGHTEADPIRENEVVPSGEENGSYDEVVYCSVCGEELSRVKKIIEATVRVDLSTCEVTIEYTSINYSGNAQEPSVVVQDGMITLENGVDYMISYANNIEPGIAMVTVMGIGNYTGTITVQFIIKEKESVENPFVDVSETAYYYDAVLWAYEKGITTGKDAAHFLPDTTCTRAQVVTFLWRAKGEPEPAITENPFEDVKTTDYYYKAVLWAYENGITTGKDATHFLPGTTVTRNQFVTFLWRAEGKPAASISNPFVDVPDGQYYTTAVLWAYENGVTTGKDAAHFQPENGCTRAQVAAFLYRAYHKN